MRSPKKRKPVLLEGDPSKVAARVLHIDSVRLVATTFDTTPELLPETRAGSGAFVADLPVPDVEVSTTNDHIVVKIDYGFNGYSHELLQADEIESPPIEKAFVRVTASFVAIYEISSTSEAIEQKDLEAFAYINGLLNVVPFWREYLANLLNRAELPPFFAPVFNPSQLFRQPPETDPQVS